MAGIRYMAPSGHLRRVGPDDRPNGAMHGRRPRWVKSGRSTMSAVAAAFFESSHGDVIVNWVKTKVDTGNGGNAALAQAILAQGNFVEQAPLGLIVIGLAEAAGPARPSSGCLPDCSSR